jgi:glutamate-1-semialdehyde aminotransferase
MKEMQPPVYKGMSSLGAKVREGLKSVLDEAGVTAFVGGAGSFFHIRWTRERVYNYRTSATQSRILSQYFSLGMMNRGIYYLGHTNVSAITTDAEVEILLDAARVTLDEMKPLIEEHAPHLLTD